MSSNQKTLNPLDVADALRIAAENAYDLIERLDQTNETMRAASSGVLPDGTPVQDMLDELKETKALLSTSKRLLQNIHGVAIDCTSATAYATIKKIREMANDR